MITKLALLGVTVLATAGILTASPAAASVPAPVTIHESITFGSGHTPPVGVFTATGLPRCASGTFGDHLVNFNLGGHLLIIDRIYTCDGGAATLTARLALHNSPPDENGNAVGGGEWTILDGTGALAAAQGSGQDNGISSGCAPTGTLFFTCQSGVSTVVASIS